MTEMNFTSDLIALPLKTCAEDLDVVAAAQISTKGDAVLEDYLDTDGAPMTADRFTGLVNFLMKNRHGTPFEHNYFRFFYIPPAERPLAQEGKPGHYVYVPGSPEQYERQVNRVKRVCTIAYEEYENALEDKIAKEVARGVLPVYLYSSMWASCNARSIMSFLSLRSTKNGYEDMFGEQFDPIEDPMFPSYPMWEIEQVALKMEAEFARAMPLTHAAFRKHGSVSP